MNKPAMVIVTMGDERVPLFGYLYDDENLNAIHKMVPCTAVQYYEDGGRSNEVHFEGRMTAVPCDKNE